MIKNRTIQLIYQTVYCTLGLVGSIALTIVTKGKSNSKD